jgi:hypothetical protein
MKVFVESTQPDLHEKNWSTDELGGWVGAN